MSSATSKYQPGFELDNFTDTPPQRLICGVCLCVVRSPQQTVCGHRYCSACILEVANSSKSNLFPCPICKTKLRISDCVFNDRAVEREVGDLYVSCDSCSGRIQFSDLKRHTDSLCSERIQNCRFRCGFRGNEVAKHLHESQLCSRRPKECNICSLTMTLDSFGPHSVLCLAGMLVPCLRCQTSLSLAEKRSHEMFGCPASVHPCTRRRPRKYCFYPRFHQR